MFHLPSCRRWLVLAVLSPLVAGLLVLGAASAEPAKGKKYALLIGVNQYRHPDLESLKYAENDAEDLAKLLTPGGGFASVRVLTTRRAKKNDKDLPTAANIKKAVEALLEDKGENDIVLIALSGHGVQLKVKDPAGKGKDKIYPYFCPHDADFSDVDYATGKAKNLINLNDLFASLGDCDAGVKLVLMDACRSVTKLRGRTRGLDDSLVTLPRGVGALFSCAPGEAAWEADKLKHGIFFHFVLEGLKGMAKNDEAVVTWDDLGIFVKRQVSRRVEKLTGGRGKQSPHAMGSLIGESPILLRPGKVTPSEPIEKDVRQMDPATSTAFERLGARVGVFAPERNPPFAARTKDSREDGMPAFKFKECDDALLARLPRSSVPFGLDLADTKVTDAGLKQLAEQKQLQALDLRYVKSVTDAGLKHLAALQQLRRLSLYDTAITNEGLKHLADHKQLRALDLGFTEVTDEGLKHLAGLAQLQSLVLSGTEVTDAGVARLRKALPRLRIIRAAAP